MACKSVWNCLNVVVMTGAEFEHFVGQVFYENGHHAEVTRGSGDYGVDLVLDGKIAVQVKMYSSPVGPGAVQQAVAGMAFYRCVEAWVVTNSTFTKAAVALAAANGVRLIAGDELQWLADNPDSTADHRARYEAEKAQERDALARSLEEALAELPMVDQEYALWKKERGDANPAGTQECRPKPFPSEPASLRQQLASLAARYERAEHAKQAAEWRAWNAARRPAGPIGRN